MEYAWIENEHFWNTEKQEMVFTHKWVGKSKLAKIHPPYHEVSSGDASLENGKLTVGNLHLRVVDNDGMYWIVTFDNWYAPAYRVLHRTIKSLGMLKFCLIIILSIWGLADYHPGALPSWRDVKVFKKSPGGITKG